VEAAPVRQFAETVRSGQCDVMCHVHLDSGRDLQSTPDRPVGKRGRCPFYGPRSGADDERRSNLVERAARRLQFLDLQQSIEMRLRVMTSATDTERCWNQPLLHVVTDRAPRDVGQVSQILDRITGLVTAGHHIKYRQLTVTFQLSYYDGTAPPKGERAWRASTSRR